jgi:phosphoserine phosphatase RsbU/P
MTASVSVLIVDDDPVSSARLSALVRAGGYQVSMAPNGRDAWSTLQNNALPIVISDWYMPEMDGIELCRLIRAAHFPHYTYFILVTAHGGKQQYLTGMEAGADDFITKPADPDELLARLKVAERILGLHRDLRTLEGLLSICSYCRKIQEGESWGSLERYVEKRSHAHFSHGICPDCYSRVFEPSLGPLEGLP